MAGRLATTASEVYLPTFPALSKVEIFQAPEPGSRPAARPPEPGSRRSRLVLLSSDFLLRLYEVRLYKEAPPHVTNLKGSSLDFAQPRPRIGNFVFKAHVQYAGR